MPDDIKSKIADLEKELYSKDFKQHRVEDILPHKEVASAPSWDTSNDDALRAEEELRIEKRHIMMKKFAQFSIGIFAVAVVITGFIWYRGANVVSGGKIDINIAQPLTVTGGEPFETKFTIINNNNVPIDAAKLLIEYPLGFYSAANNAELPRISKELGTILSGQSIAESVNTILYGQENTSKEIAVTLEYRMAGSNATLKKTTNYSIKILSTPVNMSLQIPKEVSSGQEMVLSIEVASNSKNPLSNLVVEATYPSGFSFKSSNPAPSYSTNSWKIATLAPQEKRTITVRGIIEGQENEEKATKISIGAQNPADERFVGIVYTALTESSFITKSFLSLDIAINNKRGAEYVSTLGRTTQVDISWKNNNPANITDAVIEVKLSGDALDKYSLYASSGGFYRSLDNTIIWNRTGNQELANLEPGATGSVGFSFSPVSLGVGATRSIKNPHINFEVTARAKRPSDTGGSGDIVTSATRSIKFETELRLTARGLYFTGPFKNTGPLPPKADNETTYTISLTAKNSSNSASSVAVKTTLPIYVKWLGKISPDGENITYNDVTSEVTWNLGRIPSGGTRDASFQISLLPSVSHINTQPKLTGDIVVTGTDDFTKTDVTDRKAAITTNLSSDPQAGLNQSNVVR